jgi:hypothetical protein
MTYKTPFITAGILAGAFLLSGCAGAPENAPLPAQPEQGDEFSSEEYDPDVWVEFHAEEVKLPDGRTVICVIELDNAGVFECDWDHTY